MRTSDKTEQVCASLFAVHRDLANPKKDSKADAGKFSYTYLSLPALVAYLRPILKEYQLFCTQELSGSVNVTTTVWHLSGQFIEFGPAHIETHGDEQQQGKAATYCRRYSLAAAFNIAADEDDDMVSVGPLAAEKKRAYSSPDKAAARSGKRAVPDPGSVTVGEVVDEIVGGIALATDKQWADLLSAVDGKTKDAAERINQVNGTKFTYATARAAATSDELEKAIP